MEVKEKLTKQEENWMLMTTLQIPWKDANSIDSRDDRDFLLEKVKEVQQFLQKQQEVEMQQQQMQQRMSEQRQGGGSPIITPQDILQGK